MIILTKRTFEHKYETFYFDNTNKVDKVDIKKS